MSGKIICPICIDVADDVVSVPCGHIYHDHCLKEWMRHSSLCPTCRRELSNLRKVFPQFNEVFQVKDLEKMITTLKDELEKDKEASEQFFLNECKGFKKVLAQFQKEIQNDKKASEQFFLKEFKDLKKVFTQIKEELQNDKREIKDLKKVVTQFVEDSKRDKKSSNQVKTSNNAKHIFGVGVEDDFDYDLTFEDEVELDDNEYFPEEEIEFDDYEYFSEREVEFENDYFSDGGLEFGY